MNWLRRLLLGTPELPATPELDERERQVTLTLARASGRTVDDIEREARRRRLQIEVSSQRHR